ncbi:MAG: triose-phosphate isomerase [Actinomycetota bacterium]|nr:triose-phosphate isomerase [Actinomycetota bacterium]
MTVTPSRLVAASTKAYLGAAKTRSWLAGVLAAADRPAVIDGSVEVAVLPAAPLLTAALDLSRGTPVNVGAQDVSRFAAGAFTGEVSADLLAELGVRYVEIGHAERVWLLGETPAVVREKVAQATRVGLVPLVCVGEPDHSGPRDAARVCAAQLEAMGVGDLETVIAYEPVWAIGATEPAPAAYVVEVASRLREHIRPDTRLLYGGSAGPGTFTGLAGAVDGLFLGRFAHDPQQLHAILDEVAV